ncbi:four helix bundle protein [Verrucomicrobia bacterium S94]|nr:four helix bundle protein [Verrucomicrobia bacterium S94]
MKDFRELKCWKACRELRRFVHARILPLLSRDEKYRLADQLIRVARSTTANIAEGHGRFHYLDNAKFCGNARGSAYEVLDHLQTALDEALIDEALFREGEKLVWDAVKLTNGYMNYLKKAKDPVPGADD